MLVVLLGYVPTGHSVIHTLMLRYLEPEHDSQLSISPPDHVSHVLCQFTIFDHIYLHSLPLTVIVSDALFVKFLLSVAIMRRSCS